MFSLLKSNKYSKNIMSTNTNNRCYSSFYPNPKNNNQYLLLSIAIVYYLMNKKHKY